MDRQVQRGGVEVPHAFASKYPKVGDTWGSFWMFPSHTLSVDPRSGVERRHHLFEERLHLGLKKAVAAVGVVKPVLVHTLRHAFAELGHRHSYRARVAGSFRRLDNNDLHPSAKRVCWRHSQPTGCPTSGVIDGSARHTRTAIPRSRIRAFACPTVYSP